MTIMLNASRYPFQSQTLIAYASPRHSSLRASGTPQPICPALRWFDNRPVLWQPALHHSGWRSRQARARCTLWSLAFDLIFFFFACLCFGVPKKKEIESPIGGTQRACFAQRGHSESTANLLVRRFAGTEKAYRMRQSPRTSSRRALALIAALLKQAWLTHTSRYLSPQNFK